MLPDLLVQFAHISTHKWVPRQAKKNDQDDATIGGNKPSNIPMIFHMIVSSSRKPLCYVWPFITQFFMGLGHYSFFFFGPVGFVNVRIWGASWKFRAKFKLISAENYCTQVIMPSFSALFATSTTNPAFFWKLFWYLGPTLSSIFLHHFSDCVVFIRRPHTTENKVRNI